MGKGTCNSGKGQARPTMSPFEMQKPPDDSCSRKALFDVVCHFFARYIFRLYLVVQIVNFGFYYGLAPTTSSRNYRTHTTMVAQGKFAPRTAMLLPLVKRCFSSSGGLCFLSLSILSAIFAFIIARMYGPFVLVTSHFKDPCVLSGRRYLFFFLDGLFLPLRFWCFLVISLPSSFILFI
jgi:hypothetical protein